MNIDWLQVLTTILLVVAGYLVEYFKTKTKLVDTATVAIAYAEKTYRDYTKAGSQKFLWCVDTLYNMVPVPLRFVFSKDVIGKIVQTVFNTIKSYADQQLDKVVDDIVK